MTREQRGSEDMIYSSGGTSGYNIVDKDKKKQKQLLIVNFISFLRKYLVKVKIKTCTEYISLFTTSHK